MKPNRRPFVAGNWKLHMTLSESVALARTLEAGLARRHEAEVGVAPVATSLHVVSQALEGSGVVVAAQNMHWEDRGAYTGEISAPLLLDAGASHVILGHSERRHVFGEQDEAIRKKLAAALSHGLVPILCVGEQLSDREGGRTTDVVLGQLDAALDGLEGDQAQTLVVAYEPVWAIGTGRTASPADAQEVHAQIRARLTTCFGPRLAESLRILYGGSVKPANAAELLACPDVDGALVGGASLEADTFLPIVEAAG